MCTSYRALPAHSQSNQHLKLSAPPSAADRSCKTPLHTLKLIAAGLLFVLIDQVPLGQGLLETGVATVWPQPPALEEQLRARRWAPAAAGRPLTPGRAEGSTAVGVGGTTYFAAALAGISSSRPASLTALERAASIRDAAASGLIGEMNAERPTPAAAALAAAVPQALPGMAAVELRQCALILRLWATVEHHDCLLRSPAGVSAECRRTELPHLYKLALADCQRVLASPADSCRFNRCYQCSAYVEAAHLLPAVSAGTLTDTQFLREVPDVALRMIIETAEAGLAQAKQAACERAAGRAGGGSCAGGGCSGASCTAANLSAQISHDRTGDRLTVFSSFVSYMCRHVRCGQDCHQARAPTPGLSSDALWWRWHDSGAGRSPAGDG